MPASGISLVDANVWLALAVDAHVHHAAALRWFAAQADESCAFCRLTQLALLRHLTNAKIMGEANVQTQEQAWQVYESLTRDPRVVYVDEPAELTPVFCPASSRARPTSGVWTTTSSASRSTMRTAVPFARESNATNDLSRRGDRGVVRCSRSPRR
jgi:uncharacterized protein